MALPICLEIPELGDPPVITLPGGVSIQQFNLMEAIQPALTPLMPVFDIIDTVVAVFNCVKAIPDSLGPPPDPTALAACIPELAEKVSKLLKLIPQLSLPYTIIGIIDRLGPNGAAWVVAQGSVAAKRFQSGYLTSYALIMLLGLVAAITWVLF